MAARAALTLVGPQTTNPAGGITGIRETWRKFGYPLYDSRDLRDELLHYHDLTTVHLERMTRSLCLNRMGPGQEKSEAAELEIIVAIDHIKFLRMIAQCALQSRQKIKKSSKKAGA